MSGGGHGVCIFIDLSLECYASQVVVSAFAKFSVLSLMIVSGGVCKLTVLSLMILSLMLLRWWCLYFHSSES